MTELEKTRSYLDWDLAYVQERRWVLEATRLHYAVTDALEADKAAAKQTLSDHYDTRTQSLEITRAAYIREAMARIEASDLT